MGLFTKKPKTIFDVFDQDLRKFPNNTFKSEELKDKTIYRKLDPKNKFLNVFTYLEIESGKSGYKIYNMDVHAKDVSRSQIERIINQVFSLYGRDDLGEGAFSSDDIDTLECQMPLVRSWTENRFPIRCHLLYYHKTKFDLIISDKRGPSEKKPDMPSESHPKIFIRES
jgi:hypothetical protein